ncbi:MAG TPA: glycosyltransferase, partial [Candidatus Angelobacter sp.]
IHLAVLQAAGPYMQDVPQDVAIHLLGASRVRYTPLGILRLAWKLRPHTILSTLGHLNVAVVATKPFMPRGTRVIIREATVPGSFLQQVPRHPRLWRWLFQLFYKRADRIVCLSNSTMDELVVDFRVPREKLVRIYNPIDTKKVHALAELEGNPFCGAGPHLLSVGALRPEKGIDLLIEAMPSVLQHLPGAQLTVLGEGPQLRDLTEQSDKLGLSGNVRFQGFQKNPWRYMRFADVFVLPSRFEGLPNALLEALTLGTKVVATDCPGGIREIQSHARRMTLAPLENPAALAEAIISAWKSPTTNSCSRESSPYMLSEFDLPQVMHEYSKLLLS